MRTISKWSLGIGLPVGIFCLQVCIPSHARQSNPQERSAAATSPRPRGLKLRKGPPLVISDGVDAFHIQGVSAYEALQYISRKYNIVIGMEGAVYKTDPKINLDFSGGTVGDLLNAFVARAPDYRWQSDRGIIHVFRNGAPASLANVVLNYPGASGKERYEIWRTLHTLPEYVSWMKTHQCRPFERIRPLDFKFNDGPIDIAPGQMTVAQLLDQVAKKSGDGFWAVLQSDPSDSFCRVSVIDWSW
jgi:hypothetical protein